eukprot:scaffold27073_cov30-Tisochrysis_lutea.AAC.1
MKPVSVHISSAFGTALEKEDVEMLSSILARLGRSIHIQMNTEQATRPCGGAEEDGSLTK